MRRYVMAKTTIFFGVSSSTTLMKKKNEHKSCLALQDPQKSEAERVKQMQFTHGWEAW